MGSGLSGYHVPAEGDRQARRALQLWMVGAGRCPAGAAGPEHGDSWGKELPGFWDWRGRGQGWHFLGVGGEQCTQNKSGRQAAPLRVSRAGLGGFRREGHVCLSRQPKVLPAPTVPTGNGRCPFSAPVPRPGPCLEMSGKRPADPWKAYKRTHTHCRRVRAATNPSVCSHKDPVRSTMHSSTANIHMHHHPTVHTLSTHELVNTHTESPPGVAHANVFPCLNTYNQPAARPTALQCAPGHSCGPWRTLSA